MLNSFQVYKLIAHAHILRADTLKLLELSHH